MKKEFVLGIMLLAGSVLAGKACEHCNALVVKNTVPEKVKYFGLKEVRLLDSPFKNAMEKNAAWMLEMDMDRLLSNFLKNAGLEPKAKSYGSWESMGIAGHTLGHYLTAVSQQYASTGDERFKQRVDYIVHVLDSCQTNFVNGFIGGMPGGDKVFKEVKRGIIRSAGFDLNGIWVPWYNEHKTMMGLSDAYLLTGNEMAKKVLVNLSDYLVDVISALTKEQMQTMLNCEFGGMNEAFAQVYALTGDKKYLDASYAFYHERLMDQLAQEKDILPGLHSNTQIPKIIGSARQYELIGNERDETIAEFFWNTMVNHHSYANGGNSSGEYLSFPDKLNDRLTHSTCETCNTYNMLKLSQHLYKWTGDARYIDYYEKALYNHILSSQNPTDGMTCYFVPLAMGTRKEFCGKYNSFTCCMGSGFENHSKYGGAIYSHSTDNKALYVDLYIPSELSWQEKGLKLKMETAYPADGHVVLRIMEGKRQPLTVNLRYPAWAHQGIVVKVNGSKQKITAEPGSFISLERNWKVGDRIEMDIPMDLYTQAMPDNADRRAVFYGPTLLAGDLGKEEVEPIRGVPVLVSENKTVCEFVHPVAGKPLTFETKALGYPKDVTLRPFYDTYDHYYTVYWDVFSPQEWKEKQAEYEAERLRIEELNKMTVDYITLGEMQPERDHDLRAEESRVGDFRGKKYRYAYPAGYFDFDMKVSGTEPMKLMMTFWGGDCGRDTFEILVNGELLQLFTPKGEDGKFVENTIAIPEKYTQGKDKIRISFKGREKNRVTSLYDCRMMR